MIGWNYWHCIPTKLIDAERFTHELMKHVVKLTNENELNCVNLCYRFVSYNWKIPKFFLLNSFFFIKKGTTLGNAGRFWTFFFLVSRRFKGLFFVCLLEVYQLTKKGLWSAWKPTQSAGFFPTQSATLVKVSGGYHHIQLVGGGFPVRNLDGCERYELEKTFEDRATKALSEVWPISTDFLGPAKSYSVEPKLNKSQIQSTCIYITAYYLKKVCFGWFFVNVLNERGSASVPYGISFAVLCF